MRAVEAAIHVLEQEGVTAQIRSTIASPLKVERRPEFTLFGNVNDPPTGQSGERRE